MTSHSRSTGLARRRPEQTLTLDDGTVCPPAYEIHGEHAAAVLDRLTIAITAEIARLREPTPWDKLPKLAWQSMRPLAMAAGADPAAVSTLAPATALAGVALACLYGVLTRSQGTQIRTLDDRRRSYVERRAELHREE